MQCPNCVSVRNQLQPHAADEKISRKRTGAYATFRHSVSDAGSGRCATQFYVGNSAMDFAVFHVDSTKTSLNGL